MDVESTTRWQRAAGLAATQHGRITLAQLRTVGIMRGSVEKARRSGRLHLLFDGVYALGHRAPSPAADHMAAVLRCGDEAALSHRPAAMQHGLRGVGAWPIDVTSPAGHGRGVRGIRVHRASLGPVDRVVVDGVPVTSVARTIADLGHTLAEADLRALIREAQYRRSFSLDAVLLANARRPSRLLSAVLDDLVLTESPLEDLFRRRVLKPFRIPEPEVQDRLPGARPDFRWPQARLIVEIDGGHHANPLTRQADAARDNALQLAGELVLRYSKPDLTRRTRNTANQITRALRERGGYDIS